MRIPSHIDTTATVAGDDLLVRAVFDYQPAERGTGVYPGAGAEITLTCVWYADCGNVMDMMSPDEIGALEDALLMEVQALIAEQHEMEQDWRYYA